MNRTVLFTVSVAPSLAILGYGVAITRAAWASEALWTAFFVGGVGAVASVPIELGLSKLVELGAFDPVQQAALVAMLVAAIPEESIKFLLLLGVAEKHVDARRRQDVVVLALAVSLGFATMENLFYVALPKDWQLIAAMRAITAVPGHGVFGLTMGALVLGARLRPDRARARMLLALLVPIGLHAAYDFPLLVPKAEPAHATLVGIWLVVLLVAAILPVWLCRRALPMAAEADRISGRDTRPNGPAVPLIVWGCLLAAAAPIIAVTTLWLEDDANPWLGGLLGILPVVLAFDLIWTGLRRLN